MLHNKVDAIEISLDDRELFILKIGIEQECDESVISYFSCVDADFFISNFLGGETLLWDINNTYGQEDYTIREIEEFNTKIMYLRNQYDNKRLIFNLPQLEGM